MSPDFASVVVRGLAFVLLFQATGTALFVVMCGRLLETSGELLRRMQRVTALGGAILIAVHLLLESARLTGTYAGALDPGMQRLTLVSTGAASHALQMVGLIVLASSALHGTVQRRAIVATGVLLVMTAFPLTGHTTTLPMRPLLAPLLFVHVLVVAYWFGSLLPLCVVLHREPPRVAAQVVNRFSALAVWLVPALALAGLVLVLAIARGVPALDQPYGALMLTKVSGFAILLGLAGLNKLRLVPALVSGQRAAPRRLQNSILLEAVVLIGVMAATSVLTTFYSP